jgi:ATP-dependent Clp protease ATP-binding subunit ClpC
MNENIIMEDLIKNIDKLTQGSLGINGVMMPMQLSDELNTLVSLLDDNSIDIELMFTLENFMLKILTTENNVKKYLTDVLNIDITPIINIYEENLNNKKSNNIDDFINILNYAENEASSLNDIALKPEHIFLSILKHDITSAEIYKNIGVEYHSFVNYISKQQKQFTETKINKHMTFEEFFDKINKTGPISDELFTLLHFINNTLSKELPTLTIDLEYIILAIFTQKQSYIYKQLEDSLMSSSMEAIYESYYEVVSSKALSAIKNGRKIIIDDEFVNMFFKAYEEAKNLNSNEVTSEHVFLSILNNADENNKTKKVFNKAGVTYNFIKSKIKNGDDVQIAKPDKKNHIKEIKIISNTDVDDETKEFLNKFMSDFTKIGTEDLPGMPKLKKGKNPYINTYCTNLNNLVEQGKIEPLVGREREVNEIIRILGRKKKNNAILLGGEGVGKTAIGESIAHKIINGNVPDFLQNRVLVSLDMTALLAGTTLRGMFEERVKGILDEIKADPSFILFMDNIGAILADKGKNDYEISSMLARSLENGEIQVIGTSDFKSYRKTFDKDPSLARRFQKIIVEAPNIKETICILNGLKNSYENFHHVLYNSEAIESCVFLADKYIPERNLPDSAIDIMDEIGALKGTIQDSEYLNEIKQDIKVLEAKIKGLTAEKKYEDADIYQKELTSLKRKYTNEKKEFIKNREDNPYVVTKDDILEIVSIKTNIPVNNLTADDKKKLIDMNERIKSNVIGQDEAIDTICKALKRNRVGLHNGKCMYSAMAIGKTGVGKTLIAKQLAKELFGDEKALVRFDMSEFSDKVAVNKLIGSNPGYVGYEEGGQLTETIKNKKHCVLLLDEIEKADPEIYNIFLQVLDEGFLTDNSGMKVDFKNVIVLFTSNIGAKAASDFGKGIGFNENESENTKRILLKQLKNKFPPEFLNRLDDVIYFNSLNNDNLKDIIKVEIEKLHKRVNNLGYKISYDEKVLDFILEKIKDDSEFGARPIMRTIQDVIENKITDTLLENAYPSDYTFSISYNSELNDVMVE